MRLAIAAAFALATAPSLHAQAVTAPPPSPLPPPVDYSTAMPIDGSWSWSPVAGGSAATFVNAAGMPQLTISCALPLRQITFSKPASGAAPFLSVWTSAQTRNLPASYKPATGRIEATVGAYDPLLDAIAFSRGRAGFSIAGQPPLIVPSWAEAARVIEDCRA